MSTTATSVDVATWVARFGDALFRRLDDLAALAAAQLDTAAPRRSDLRIEAWCRDLLTEAGTGVAGAGAVLAPGVLADAPYWLEWWTSDGRGRPESIAKLAAETDPRAVGFRDYTELPWYERPFTTGARHVTGPYVDYLCTDQYTLTFTRPLRTAGDPSRFAGVVGADVLVARIEEQLLDVMDVVDEPCVIVNASGRVVTSSDPAWVTGDLVRGLPLDAWSAGRDEPTAPWRATRCADLSFFVITPR